MKLLLIDNDGDTLSQLKDLCQRCGYDTTVIHCSQINLTQAATYDVIVLSGGYWYDNETQNLQNYKLEIDLIQQAPAPILGICIGMLLMHVAEGREAPRLDEPQTGSKQIAITPLGQKMLNLPPTVAAHKNHTRGIMNAANNFEILGTSPGHVEIMKHRTKPLLGVQFHPEIGDQNLMDELFKKLITTITANVFVNPKK